MITTVLARLERGGGAALRDVAGPPVPTLRWFRTDRGGYSAGRFSGGLELCADRLDEGLLVAPRPASDADENAEWIVWLGDLRIEPRDRAGRAIDVGSARPDVRVCGRSVRLEWPLRATTFRLDFSVLCRPVGHVTFENDALNGDVRIDADGDRSVATVHPYPSLEPVRIHFDGRANFEPASHWRRGIETTDAEGRTHYEDRFYPGAFEVRCAEEAESIVLRFEVERAVAVPEPPPGEGDGWGGDSRPTAAVGEHLARDPDRLAGTLAGALSAERAHDRALPSDRVLWWLWAARAASDGSSNAIDAERARELRMQVVRPALARLVRAWSRAAHPGPLHDVLRGARRRRGLEDTPASSSASIGVESAALLHDAVTWLATLADEDGQREMANDAMRRALQLRRWFQSAFWLRRPDRPADVAMPCHTQGRDADFVERTRAMALRAGMLVAAALPDPPLSARQRRTIVRLTESRLMTPLGVRSLDAEDARFDPLGPSTGAVWPWMIGPFVEATLRAFGPERSRLRAFDAWLNGLGESPEAWALDRDPSVPIGALRYLPNQLEERRARALVRRGACLNQDGVT